MKRRPEQTSMLSLMGIKENAGERYARRAHVVPGTDRVDGDGNVKDVTVCTMAWPECECWQQDPWWDQAAPEGTEE